MVENSEQISEKQIIATKEAINKHPDIEEMGMDFDDLLELYKERSSDLTDLTEKDLVEDMLEAGEIATSYFDEDTKNDLTPDDIIMLGAISMSEDLFDPKRIGNKMVQDARKIIKEDFDLDFTELFELFKEENPNLGHLKNPEAQKIVLEDSLKESDFLKIVLETGLPNLEKDEEFELGDELEFYDAVIAGIYILFGKKLYL